MSYLIIMSGFIFFSSGHKGRDREQEITAVLPLPGCRDACTLLSKLENELVGEREGSLLYRNGPQDHNAPSGLNLEPKQQHSESPRSQSPVSAPSSKEGVKGECPALGNKKTNSFCFGLQPCPSCSSEQWMGVRLLHGHQDAPGWCGHTTSLCCLISQSSVYVSVILLMTAPCQLQEEK